MRAFACGDNEHAQQGLGPFTPHVSPADAYAKLTWHAMTEIPATAVFPQAAYMGSMFIEEDLTSGYVGGNQYGQGCLGHREPAPPTFHYTKTLLPPVAHADHGGDSETGSHGVAVLADGRAVTYGGNLYGQLGRTPWPGTVYGNPEHPGASSIPVELTLPPDAIPVAGAAGVAPTALLCDGGRVLVWSWANLSGVVGDGTRTPKLEPVYANIEGAIAIAAGGGHMLALLEDGTVRAWGRGTAGQLGKMMLHSLLPVKVPDLAGVTAIAAGWDQSLARRADGSVVRWGKVGKLTAPVPTPTTVVSSGASYIAAGQNHWLAVVNGEIVAGGHNEWGQLGTGKRDPAGEPVDHPATPAGQRALVVSASDIHSLAVV